MPAKKEPEKVETTTDEHGRAVYADGNPRAQEYQGDSAAVVPALSYVLRDQDLPGHVNPGQVVTTTLVLGPPFKVKE